MDSPISAPSTAGFRLPLTRQLSAAISEIWKNYPVRDERGFLASYRSHAFADARVATWVAAIGGTALMMQRIVTSRDPEQANIGDVLAANVPDIIFGMLLFWTAPIVFAAAARWSKRNYQWVLLAVFALRYLRVGNNIWLSEYASPAGATVATLHLCLFTSAFLRLPFNVAFSLSVGGYLFVSVAAILHFDTLPSVSLIVPVAIAIGLGLFSSWRAERRERILFDYRDRAERAAARAENANAVAEQAIKQRESAIHELRHAQDRRESTIRKFHHDAKHPLIGMKPAVQEIKALSSSNEALAPIRPKVDVIHSSVRDLEQLLNLLERLIKMGDFVPRYQPVSVNRLLSSTADAHRDSAAQKNLGFEVRMREPDVLLWTDPDAAKGMLTNLLSNAVKYTRRGRVFVGSVRMRDGLRIDVRDSGVGIPGSKKDLIYKEFVRLGNRGTTDAAGQGIGLSIVANYCGKLAGHDVKHRSREGMGSCFSLRFPLAPVSSFAADDAAETLVAVLPEKLYVVIVEDNAQFRETLQTDLYSAGYDTHANVKAFSSVAELRQHFEVAQHRAPNIVISDYSLLDGENARDVLAVVDEFFGWETVPAVVYTAEAMSQLRFAREHTHLLAKSSDPTPLLNLIQRAISAARRDDQED